jgi:hypothetical protein
LRAVLGSEKRAHAHQAQTVSEFTVSISPTRAIITQHKAVPSRQVQSKDKLIVVGDGTTGGSHSSHRGWLDIGRVSKNRWKER